MKKIGILYICTGPYIVFWKEFFLSFEKYFLPSIEKHYFVFTDSNKVYCSDTCNRIHIINTKPAPWPLPTLMKFHLFLSVKNDLLKCDYLYQSNANIVCRKIVKEEDFLPNPDMNEHLFFVIHPGFTKKKPKYSPYDRNSKSMAFVPYSNKNIYVFGAMNGGTSKAYLQMITELAENIDIDLKNNIIATWHDESHINKYVCTHQNYKLLSPSYCYPVGFDVKYECIIAGVEKNNKFDVKKLKGNNNTNLLHKIKIRVFNQILKPNIHLIKEHILFFNKKYWL